MAEHLRSGPRRPERAPSGPTEPIDRYRRLVVNPLLAVASCVGAILLLRASLRSRNLAAFLTAARPAGVSLLFTQFHCLDCGATTWLFSARRHACEPALARWREGRLGPLAVARRKTQLVLWLYVLASSRGAAADPLRVGLIEPTPVGMRCPSPIRRRRRIFTRGRRDGMIEAFLSGPRPVNQRGSRPCMKKRSARRMS